MWSLSVANTAFLLRNHSLDIETRDLEVFFFCCLSCLGPGALPGHISPDVKSGKVLWKTLIWRVRSEAREVKYLPKVRQFICGQVGDQHPVLTPNWWTIFTILPLLFCFTSWHWSYPTLTPRKKSSAPFKRRSRQAYCTPPWSLLRRSPRVSPTPARALSVALACLLLASLGLTFLLYTLSLPPQPPASRRKSSVFYGTLLKKYLNFTSSFQCKNPRRD